jgi:hypothetical protein
MTESLRLDCQRGHRSGPHRFGTFARSGTASVFVLVGNTTDLFRSTKRIRNTDHSRIFSLSRRSAATILCCTTISGAVCVHSPAAMARSGCDAREGSHDAHTRRAAAKAERADAAGLIQGLDAIFRGNFMAAPEKRLKMAPCIDHASFLFPSGEPDDRAFPRRACS